MSFFSDLKDQALGFLTKDDGSFDFNKLAGLGLGGYGIYSLLQGSDDTANRPIGYTGGIPTYEYKRELLPNAFASTYTAPPTEEGGLPTVMPRRPGSGGRYYFTQGAYQPKTTTEGAAPIVQNNDGPSGTGQGASPAIMGGPGRGINPELQGGTASDLPLDNQARNQAYERPATTQTAGAPSGFHFPDTTTIDRGAPQLDASAIIRDAIALGGVNNFAQQIPNLFANGTNAIKYGTTIEEFGPGGMYGNTFLTGLRGLQNLNDPTNIQTQANKVVYQKGIPYEDAFLEVMSRTENIAKNPEFSTGLDALYGKITPQEALDANAYYNQARFVNQAADTLRQTNQKIAANEQAIQESMALYNRNGGINHLQRAQSIEQGNEELKQRIPELEQRLSRYTSELSPLYEKVKGANLSLAPVDLGQTRSLFFDPTVDSLKQGSQDLINRALGLAGGGLASLSRGYYLGGPTDGMADLVPATIDGTQPAALSDGEFVIPADVVSHLGNGNSEAGAQQLYSMMDRVRRERTGTTRQGPEINPIRMMPA